MTMLYAELEARVAERQRDLLREAARERLLRTGFRAAGAAVARRLRVLPGHRSARPPATEVAA